MHNILITKNEAYGAGDNGTVTMASLPTLKHGALVVVKDNKEIIDAAGANAPGTNSFQFLVGITRNSDYGISTQASVNIFTKHVRYINFETYNEPVKQVVEIGPFPSAADDAEGELGLTLNNSSYIGTIQTDQIRISEWKKSTETLASKLNKIVDRINKGTGLPRRAMYKSFCTAELVGSSDADYKLKITMSSEHIAFSASVYSLFEDAPVVVTTKAVISKGKGEDVRRAEDEYSAYLGNAGYGWRNELYFGKPLEADASGKYDIMTMQFDGMHDTPQNKVRAAVNWISIAIPTGAPLVATLQTIFEKMGIYKKAADEANETDQVKASGNGG